MVGIVSGGSARSYFQHLFVLDYPCVRRTAERHAALGQFISWSLVTMRLTMFTHSSIIMSHPIMKQRCCLLPLEQFDDK